MTRVVRVAGGRFAPGHIGELTRIVPFEMVDAAVAETRSGQQRVWDWTRLPVARLRFVKGSKTWALYGEIATCAFTAMTASTHRRT